MRSVVASGVCGCGALKGNALPHSVRCRGLLDMVDHEDLDRGSAGLETQAHLVVESSEDRGAVCVWLCFAGLALKFRLSLNLDGLVGRIGIRFIAGEAIDAGIFGL